MQNFKQEMEKIERYKSLDTFNISVFVYQLFGMMILSMIFFKYGISVVFNNISKEHYNDFLMLTMFIFVLPFGWFKTRKIKVDVKKQDAIKFENVNVYQFIVEYLKTNERTLYSGEHSEIIYKIITGKILENIVRIPIDVDTLNISQKSVENKTVEYSSLKVLKYLESLKPIQPLN